MFETILKFFKKMGKKEEIQKNANSKEAAKERLHLVLMQDRANVSADFLELMKQEIIEVIKKYIDVDESAIDVRLTNQKNDDDTNGAPALYANIPILNIKNEARKIDKKDIDSKKEEIEQEEKKDSEETEKSETTESVKTTENLTKNNKTENIERRKRTESSEQEQNSEYKNKEKLTITDKEKKENQIKNKQENVKQSELEKIKKIEKINEAKKQETRRIEKVTKEKVKSGN